MSKSFQHEGERVIIDDQCFSPGKISSSTVLPSTLGGKKRVSRLLNWSVTFDLYITVKDRAGLLPLQEETIHY